MKAMRNFEGLFLVAAALAVLATYANAMVPPAQTGQPSMIHVASVEQSMPTVVVHGKRLNAAEKARVS